MILTTKGGSKQSGGRTDRIDAGALERARANTIKNLLNLRRNDGHWEGELSSSALSTATAVFALAMVDKGKFGTLIAKGLSWLAEHVNEDGGWGDTVISDSNISTTVLVWAAFSLAEGNQQNQRVEEKAEQWLREKTGSLEPSVLVRAVTEKYGDDSTFSAPILTMAALSGRFGVVHKGMQWVKALPFELGLVPHAWLKWLRLPVVSYALPALIAVGQVRNYFWAPENPWVRWLRRKVGEETRDILAGIQPKSGGYLEATPITSFVVMCLAGMGVKDHIVVENGVRFLTASVRVDGSWSIDTNLATWVTTLAVKALGSGGRLKDYLSGSEREKMALWLLLQQLRREHPYTCAAPGGWAWTDLSGGVPDADDTAGALAALRYLVKPTERVIASVSAGIRWLMGLQNRDGGIPTFCRGWGKLPFDRSGPDLTAHTIAAMSVWWDELPTGMKEQVRSARERAFVYLLRTQQPEGYWIPLWFGNQRAPRQENPTYGTAQVISAIAEPAVRFFPAALGAVDRGVKWLIRIQNGDGGWGGAALMESSIEETAQAVQALGKYYRVYTRPPRQVAAGEMRTIKQAIETGISWLIEHTRGGRKFEPAPIGLYFAKLWYYEQLYPVIFTAAALEQYEQIKSLS